MFRRNTLLIILILLLFLFATMIFLSDFVGPVARNSLVSVAEEGFKVIVSALAGALAAVFGAKEK